jgi:hypothetical protein
VLGLAHAEGGALVELVELFEVERLATAPSAVRPEASRLNQMLTKARKRCHATPIVGWSETVIIQANEVRIFTAATT